MLTTTILQHLIIGTKKKALLESYGWYRNLAGGWTHPHCMDFMSRSEIHKYSVEELEYKLQHGSRAAIPH